MILTGMCNRLSVSKFKKKIQKHAKESVPHFLERIVALANGSISMTKFSAILFFIKTHNFFMLFPIELYKRTNFPQKLTDV